MRQRREASACVVCCLCIAYAFSRCCNFLTCSGDSLLSLSPFRCVSHSAGGIAFGTKSAACKSRVSVCLCVDVCRCVDVQYLPPAHKIVLSLYLRGLQKERKREREGEREEEQLFPLPVTFYPSHESFEQTICPFLRTTFV